MLGALGIVESWLSAVNDANRDAVLALSADDVEIVGPRGVGRGHELLGDWIARAGFTSTPLRWFCGEDGRVVVEQDAAWSVPGAEVPSRARVASAFVVREGRVARFQRFESVEAALSGAALAVRDEVVTRS